MTTAWTPGTARAAVTSIDRIRACAYGDRSRRGVQHPRLAQVGDIARPSRDLVQRVGPADGSADDAERAGGTHAGGRRAGEDGVHDLPVAGAAAEVAAQVVHHVGLGRRRLLVEQRHGGQQHAGRAEPALHRAVIDERLLERMEGIGVAEALHREHLAAVGLDGEVGAGADRRAVDEHRAGAADLEVAGALGALQVEPVAERRRAGARARARRSRRGGH